MDNENHLVIVAVNQNIIVGYISSYLFEMSKNCIAMIPKKIIKIDCLISIIEENKANHENKLIEETLKWGKDNRCDEAETMVYNFNKEEFTIYKNNNFEIDKYIMRRCIK